MNPAPSARRSGVGRRRPQGRPVPTNRRVSTIAADKARLEAATDQVVGANPAGAVPVEPAPRRAIAPFQIGRVKPVGTRRINMMVYGPYGHGKTFLAGSALDVPEMADVLFIAADPGDMTLTDRRSLDIININKYDQIARIFEYLTLHCKWRDEGNVAKMLEYEQQLKSEIIPLDEQTAPAEEGRTWFVEQRLRTGKPLDEPYMYRTVIIDSISEVHKYLVYKYTGVDIGVTKLSDEIEKMEEWQPAQELFRLFVRSFRDLPMNVIFVSAESIEPEQRNKRRNPLAGQALPKLAGQMAGDIAGFIDIVGYLVREMEGGETHRYLYLGAGYEGWISKHRFVNLPDLEFLEDPSMQSLIDLARKDAELHGTSQPGSDTLRKPIAPSRNAARPAASNSRRTAVPVRASGSRNAVRRGR